MSEGKKKSKKKRTKRSKKQIIEDHRRKADEMEANLAAGSIKTALKDDRVADENIGEYKKLLRQLRGIERAPSVLSDFGKDDEAKVAEKIHQKLIAKLENLLEDESDEEEEDESEDESEEEEDDSDEEEEDEDDDDEEDDD